MQFLRTCRALPRSAIHLLDAVQVARPSPAFGACGYARFASKLALPRDPERPKLPLSAYFRFAADHRQKQALKGGKDSVRETAAAWKGLQPEQKRPFEEAAKSEREAYQKAFAAYRESGKQEAWTRDPNQPKRPATPWIQWATAERKSPRFANVKMTEATKLLKIDWDALPESKKEALQTQFKADMEKYKAAMAEYKASGSETDWLQRTGRLELMQKEQAKKAKLQEKELEKKTKLKEAKEKLRAKEAEKKAQAKLKEKEAKEKLKLVAAKKKEAERLAKEKLKAKEAERKAKEVMRQSKVKTWSQRA
mmetsp:Transcript_92735/g.206161  ORF Transcript_92735/g.206161 Transcript_92735/m.206161 type:complete len:308 (+) Transcript_92735:43-966(+)